jgi:citrate synthase
MAPLAVRDLMSSPAVTAPPGETVAAAAARMHASHVGSVVVVEGDRPTGIVTERDLLRCAATAGSELPRLRVESIMTRSPETIEASTEIGFALERMVERSFRHLPVIDAGGALVGVVGARDLMRVLRVPPAEGTPVEVPRGLKGVVVAETEIGDVRGREGFYHYRQYSAIELAENRTFEEVWFLLLEGWLPTSLELREFQDEVARERILPDAVAGLLPEIAAGPRHDDPLRALAAVLLLVGREDGMKPVLDTDAAARRRDALRLCALTPVVLCSLYRLGRGLEPVPPGGGRTAEEYIRMLTGEGAGDERAGALERYLVSTIDHGFNASTFAARVIASTGADVASAFAGALGALSGPLHGGAPSRALDALDEIGDPVNTDSWVRSQLAAGNKIMGFGHSVYRTEDPRSRMLKETAAKLGGPRVPQAAEIEDRVVRALQELKPGRELYANVELYAGVLMEACGIPREMFTPTFATSRTVGWGANILEEAAAGKIIRPTARYVGPPPPEPVPAA